MSVSRGARGEAVRVLQRKLQTLGFYSGPVDGIFGAQTAQAVRHFQRWGELRVDGIAGPNTLRHLHGAGFQRVQSRGVPGRNEKLFAMVGNIQRFKAEGVKTFCNLAFNVYAAKFGFREFVHAGERKDFIANEMFLAMSAGNGWKKVTAQEAIAAAQEGKLVAAGWYNRNRGTGRDGKSPGHIAMVLGEYSPGVPGIAQAGRKTFSWGPVTENTRPATYFVYEGTAASR